MTLRLRPGAGDDQQGGETRGLLAADGVRVEATHWAAPDGLGDATASGPVLVVCHGFGGSRHRDDNAAVLRWLRPRGPVIALDFRGHGNSAGATTMGQREVLDLDAVLRWARTLGYAQVVPVGFSMGASVVLRHAALHGGTLPAEAHEPADVEVHEAVDAVVAVSGPARWFYRGSAPMRTLHRIIGTSAGRSLLRRAGGPRVDISAWDEEGPLPLTPVRAAGLLPPTPLLVVHGDADDYFPVEHAESIVEGYRAAGAGGRAELWVEPGVGHAEAGMGEALVDRISAWARAAAARPGSTGEEAGGATTLGPA